MLRQVILFAAAGVMLAAQDSGDKVDGTVSRSVGREDVEGLAAERQRDGEGLRRQGRADRNGVAHFRPRAPSIARAGRDAQDRQR